MSNYLSKICPELLKVAQMGKDETKNDCIVYTRYFSQALCEAERLGIKVKSYPFISAFGASLTSSQIVHFARTNMVNFISKQAKVSALIDVSKKVLSLDTLYERD